MQIQKEYPRADTAEILRMLEDFDNNAEMVLELLGSKNPPKVDLNEPSIVKYKI